MRITKPSSASRCPDMLAHSKVFPLVNMGWETGCLVTCPFLAISPSRGSCEEVLWQDDGMRGDRWVKVLMLVQLL